MSNENEARDAHGRWTTGGVGTSDAHAHPAGPYMDIKNPEQAEKADIVAKHAADVAKKLGYDPANINIVDDTHPFELNGKTLQAAGVATWPPEPKLVTDPDGSKHVANDKRTGTITLFTPTIGNDEGGIKGVVAHEITHQKFNALLNDSRADYIKMQQDPDWNKEWVTKWVTYDPDNPMHIALRNAGHMLTDSTTGQQQVREFGFMRPDGLLNDPYAAKYPAYQAYTKAMMPSTEDFAKSDGVSEYSKEYWLGTRNPMEGSAGLDSKGEPIKTKTYAVPTKVAFHETLAEIGRLKYSGDPVYHKKLVTGASSEGKDMYFSQGKKGINPKWNALYKAMDDNWKRRGS